MATLDFNAPLSKYFKDEVVEAFDSLGIESLDEIIDFVMENPNGWADVLKWDQARTNGLVKWLFDNSKGNFELSDQLLKKGEKLYSPFYAKTEPIEDITSHRWDQVVNPENIPGRKQRRAGEKIDDSPVHPLELIKLPASCDGRNGTNRGAPEDCALKADNDADAVKAWLKARATNQNTMNAYRKEGERFLLWSVLERQTAMSSLDVEDCSLYLRWLEQLGRLSKEDWAEKWRQPQSIWIGPKNVSRASSEWRPFNCQLSYSSRRSAFVVVRQMFSFLHKTGYLRFNPFDQIPSKIPFLPGEGKPREFADRSLTHDQWDEVTAYLAEMPESYEKDRLSVILVLGKGLGMRATEMLNARCSWITFRMMDGNQQALIYVVGKGDKERILPLSDEQLDIINKFLARREAGYVGSPESAEQPLLASRRPRKNQLPVLSRSGLYRILADFLEEVALKIQKKRPLDASKLRASSTHWLRHTFAVTSLETMPVNVVQNALGHASVGTTSKYIAPDQREMIEAMKDKTPL